MFFKIQGLLVKRYKKVTFITCSLNLDNKSKTPPSFPFPLQGNQHNLKSLKSGIISIKHYKYCLNRLHKIHITTYIKIYPNIEIYFKLVFLVTLFFKVTCVGFEDTLFLHT